MVYSESVCFICYDLIPPGQHAKDADGHRWTVHRGSCAVEAGILETTTRTDSDNVEPLDQLLADVLGQIDDSVARITTEESRLRLFTDGTESRTYE
jgi:hypothetical protein